MSGTLRHCYRHSTRSGLPVPLPCEQCLLEGRTPPALPLMPLTPADAQAEAKYLYEQERRRLVELINSVNIPAFKEAERQQQIEAHEEALRKKCVHDIPYLVCVECWKRDLNYDRETYREQINLAVSKTKATFILKNELDDLVQIIDFEIWKSVRFYGDKMNQALAYAIAENQARKCLGNLLKQPQFESLDERTEANGEVSELSPVEVKENIQSNPSLAPDSLVMGSDVDRNQASIETVENKRPQLEAYVRGLRGDAGKVGAAILKDPQASIRDIERTTGIPKSTVDRVRRVLFGKFGDILKS